MKNWRQKAS
ncbi:hypothetical protein CGLO_13441 [Colletotrichum gloeosporioides Cg-14]|uniref:Uncharacterized protein n=1 Tax=Colletotrichum gloeosporioides (strain Cg-14) TaxID=1237896 RepID=T0K3P3_COLGC|nr:hypothetical protein CGLO_13441 [Colletotrichum gloeosporioides Cg-14]